MVELKVRIGPKGQVVIPKILRETFKLYPKQEVVIKAENEGVLIKKNDENFIERLREIARSINIKKSRLSSENLKKIRDEQYKERARKSGIRI